MTLSIFPADVAQAGQRAVGLAETLAGEIDQLGEAPLLMSLVRPGDPGHCAADLEHALSELRKELQALLRFAAQLGASPAQITAVDQQLAHAVPPPRISRGPSLTHVALTLSGVAGTLLAEALVHATPPEALRLIDPLLDFIPDGPGWAGPVGAPQTETVSPRSPAAWLTTISEAEARPGQITVTHLDTDGWVISMPGIHNFTEAADPLDSLGAAHAFASGHGAYANAVVSALTIAGAPLGAHIMLVGHSQGGIVAADLAADSRVTSRWQVTHVLAAAAPIDTTAVPAETAVLAGRNRDDIVPGLDLQTKSRSGHATTITFDAERGSIGANHDLAGTYTPFAASRQFEDDPGVVAWEASARRYLSGGPATVQSFQLLDQAPTAPASSLETGPTPAPTPAPAPTPGTTATPAPTPAPAPTPGSAATPAPTPGPGTRAPATTPGRA